MDKTREKKWKEIAEKIQDLEEVYSDLMDLLGTVPKSVKGPQMRKVDDATTKLKSTLEDRMFKEHSSDWDDDKQEKMLSLFYGTE